MKRYFKDKDKKHSATDSHAGTMNNGSTHDTRKKRRATDNCTVENTSPTRAARIQQI